MHKLSPIVWIAAARAFQTVALREVSLWMIFLNT